MLLSQIYALHDDWLSQSIRDYLDGLDSAAGSQPVIGSHPGDLRVPEDGSQDVGDEVDDKAGIDTIVDAIREKLATEQSAEPDLDQMQKLLQDDPEGLEKLGDYVSGDLTQEEFLAEVNWTLVEGPNNTLHFFNTDDGSYVGPASEIEPSISVDYSLILVQGPNGNWHQFDANGGYLGPSDMDPSLLGPECFEEIGPDTPVTTYAAGGEEGDIDYIAESDNSVDPTVTLANGEGSDIEEIVAPDQNGEPVITAAYGEGSDIVDIVAPDQNGEPVITAAYGENADPISAGSPDEEPDVWDQTMAIGENGEEPIDWLPDDPDDSTIPVTGQNDPSEQLNWRGVSAAGDIQVGDNLHQHIQPSIRGEFTRMCEGHGAEAQTASADAEATHDRTQDGQEVARSTIKADVNTLG